MLVKRKTKGGISFRGYELIRKTPKFQVILSGVYFGLLPGFRFKVFQPMILWLLQLIGVYVFVLATPTGRSILGTPTARSTRKINLPYNTESIIVEGQFILSSHNFNNFNNIIISSKYNINKNIKIVITRKTSRSQSYF